MINWSIHTATKRLRRPFRQRLFKKFVGGVRRPLRRPVDEWRPLNDVNKWSIGHLACRSDRGDLMRWPVFCVARMDTGLCCYLGRRLRRRPEELAAEVNSRTCPPLINLVSQSLFITLFAISRGVATNAFKPMMNRITSSTLIGRCFHCSFNLYHTKFDSLMHKKSSIDSLSTFDRHSKRAKNRAIQTKAMEIWHNRRRRQRQNYGPNERIDQKDG